MSKDIHHRILIVDDDARLRNLLVRFFQEQDFTVKAVPNGEAMDRALAYAHFDLIVLDLMLPGADGLSICRRLRANGNFIPIIMLTAKSGDDDRIAGLETGVDDYLAKPFNPRELLARVRAVVRRKPVILPGTPSPCEAVVKFGSVLVDLGAHTLYRNGKQIPITMSEFSLLKALLQNPGSPLSRDKLMKLSRRRKYETLGRAIDVQILRLRKLVEDDPSKPRYIQTVWGLGYAFVPDANTLDTAED